MVWGLLTEFVAVGNQQMPKSAGKSRKSRVWLLREATHLRYPLFLPNYGWLLRCSERNKSGWMGGKAGNMRSAAPRLPWLTKPAVFHLVGKLTARALPSREMRKNGRYRQAGRSSDARASIVPLRECWREKDSATSIFSFPYLRRSAFIRACPALCPTTSQDHRILVPSYHVACHGGLLRFVQRPERALCQK